VGVIVAIELVVPVVVVVTVVERATFSIDGETENGAGVTNAAAEVETVDFFTVEDEKNMEAILGAGVADGALDG
jgi:hypothetical protein